ncbi:MAG: FAD-dependent oxidoreductase, partial [Elusimicrobiota bacterium]
MEKRGGLVKSMWLGGPKRARREGITTFMTIKNGLSRVIDALARSLPAGTVRTDCPAQAVRRRGGRWEVVIPRGVFEADAIEGFDPELAIRLREIPFVSTATTTLIYDAATFPKLPKGFGFLIPREAGSTLSAATFSSSKFPARSPEGKVVIRAFVGGAGREEPAEGPLTRIEEKVREELHRVLDIKSVSPVAAKTARWIKGNPQYNVGHARRLERLGSCLKGHSGLILAGCSYWGVGLPDCVRSGRRAAELASSARSGREHDTARAGLA